MLPDPLHGVLGLLVVVGSAQLLEDVVVVALHPHAHPVEALAPQPPEKPVGDGVGIGLKGNLRLTGHIETLADGGENRRHALRPKIGGGAAAKVDGVHQIVRSQSSRLFDVGAHRLQIAFQQAVVLTGDGVKIAVLAFAPAEGHMNIDPQRGFVFPLEKSHDYLLCFKSPEAPSGRYKIP